MVSAGAYSDASPPWVEWCASVAPTAGVIVCAAPFPTILQVYREKNVGTLPLLPYSSLLVSCFLWAVYGILINEPKIYICNIVGWIMSFCYFVVFTIHAPPRSETLPGSVANHIRIGGSIMLGALFLGTSTIPDKSYLMGKIAMIFSVALWASPLTAIRTVLATKSARSLPLPFSLSSMINCFLWSVTGILQMHDPNITIPNVLGFNFSLLQVLLVMRFGSKKVVDEKESEIDKVTSAKPPLNQHDATGGRLITKRHEPTNV